MKIDEETNDKGEILAPANSSRSPCALRDKMTSLGAPREQSQSPDIERIVSPSEIDRLQPYLIVPCGTPGVSACRVASPGCLSSSSIESTANVKWIDYDGLNFPIPTTTNTNRAFLKTPLDVEVEPSCQNAGLSQTFKCRQLPYKRDVALPQDLEDHSRLIKRMQYLKQLSPPPPPECPPALHAVYASTSYPAPPSYIPPAIHSTAFPPPPVVFPPQIGLDLSTLQPIGAHKQPLWTLSPAAAYSTPAPAYSTPAAGEFSCPRPACGGPYAETTAAVPPPFPFYYSMTATPMPFCTYQPPTASPNNGRLSYDNSGAAQPPFFYSIPPPPPPPPTSPPPPPWPFVAGTGEPTNRSGSVVPSDPTLDVDGGAGDFLSYNNRTSPDDAFIAATEAFDSSLPPPHFQSPPDSVAVNVSFQPQTISSTEGCVCSIATVCSNEHEGGALTSSDDPDDRWRRNFLTSNFVDAHCRLDLVLKNYWSKNAQRSGSRGVFSQAPPPPSQFDLQTLKKLYAATWFPQYKACITNFTVSSIDFAEADNFFEKILDNDDVWGAIGCHPLDVENYEADTESIIISKALHPKIVALGELGLDYSNSYKGNIDVQKTVFERQLMLVTREIGKPIVLHCKMAEADCYQILKRMLPHNFPIYWHCFDESVEVMDKYSAYFTRIYFGVAMDLLDEPRFNKSVRFYETCPTNRLLIESNAPKFMPSKYESALTGLDCNHPGLAVLAAFELAKIRNCDPEILLEQLYTNAQKMYGVRFV